MHRFRSTTSWSLHTTRTQPESSGAQRCSIRPLTGPALNSLISITPANAKVQAFGGTATAGAAAGSSSSGSSGSAPQSTTASAGSAGSSTTTSAAIGQIQLGVTGPGPSLSISEASINAVAGSPLFANPLQGATIVNSDTSISFPFTVSITPAASLDKNASIK